jgi:WD repeat-containing protein 40A
MLEKLKCPQMGRIFEDIKSNEQFARSPQVQTIIRNWPTILEDLKSLDDCLERASRNPRISYNAVHMEFARSVGNTRLQQPSYSSRYATKKLIQSSSLKERVYDLGSDQNKIFCSQWLNHRQVVVGTKCNSLIVLDVQTGKSFKMPCLPSSGRFRPPVESGGIHAIELNPSKTKLATGGDKTNELAIYKMPSFDPITVGEGCHEDWIFDLKWLDDEFVITGSRDGSLALWRVDDDTISQGIPYKKDDQEDVSNNSDAPCDTFMEDVTYVTALTRVECKDGKKVRSILYNHKEKDIVALTLNSRINIFDAQLMVEKSSIIIPGTTPRGPQGDSLCIAHFEEGKLYAVGNKNHVDLFDYRGDTRWETKVTFPLPSIGVRSLSFQGDILTFGTGCGNICFYDMRAQKYLLTDIQKEVVGDNSHPTPVPAVMSTSNGFVQRDAEYYQHYIQNMEYKPAIYTHAYDSTGTQLFVAGGPLSFNLAGNYAALWS